MANDTYTAAAPRPDANMGEPAPRVDGLLKVTGAARYPSDTPVGNPAYAVLVTSAIAKGRIVRLDLDDARAVPGVLDILTSENTGELKPAKFGSSSSTSIQTLGPDIAHAGQMIAVVIADTFDGRERSGAPRHYAEEKPAATFGAAGLTQEDASKVPAQRKLIPQVGDAAGAIAAADVVLDAEYSTPTQHHNPIELFATTCVSGDELTVYEPSQFVYGLKNGDLITPVPQDIAAMSKERAIGAGGLLTYGSISAISRVCGECDRLVVETKEPRHKQVLQEMARVWRNLADEDDGKKTP